MNTENRDSGGALVRCKGKAPCPFCGKSHTTMCNQFGDHFVLCLGCRAAGPERATKEDAMTAWRKRASSQKADEVCYLIGDSMGHVKIGVTTNVSKRLAALQTACPYKLHLFGTLPGGYDTEARLHDRFAVLRKHGEWFADDPDIRAEFGYTSGIQSDTICSLVMAATAGNLPGKSRVLANGDIAIASTIVRAEIAKAGRQPSTVIKMWAHSGLIRRWPAKYTHQYRIKGERVRCYVVRGEHVARLSAS